jgi:hypothetical protein
MRRMGLAVLTLVLLTGSSWADEWSRTYSISGKADLKVETTDASIIVDTWDKNTIEANVTTRNYKIGEGGITIEEKQAGNAVALILRFPHEHLNFSFHGNRSVEISIHMPKQGQVKLHTGDGSIHVSNLKGNMELDSGDGNLEVEGADGALHARTGDGHIRADGRFDGLEIKTGDGRVDTRAETGSTLGETGWEVDTGDGNITLEIPSNLKADVELQSGDGHINLEIPLTVEGRLKDNHLQGKLNGGGPPLRVHTGDGSIALRNVGGKI